MMSQKFLAFAFLFTLAFSSINTQNLGYDEDLAQELVYYSFASYCSATRILNWDIPIVSQKFTKWEDIKVISALGLQFISGYNFKRNAITFAFRGSSNLINWVSNIDAKKDVFTPCGCQVHAGFLSNYKEFKLLGLLNVYQSLKAKHPAAQLHITGHSLGGALATLMAADLLSIGAKVDLLITFGSPRVGDANFYPWFENYVKNLDTQYFRITHGNDPVPHLPLQGWGFYHVDTEVFYNEAPYICRDMFGEDPNCSISQAYSPFQTAKHSNYVYVDSSSVSGNCQ